MASFPTGIILKVAIHFYRLPVPSLYQSSQHKADITCGFGSKK